MSILETLFPSTAVVEREKARIQETILKHHVPMAKEIIARGGTIPGAEPAPPPPPPPAPTIGKSLAILALGGLALWLFLRK